ncbi:carboxylate-amine ligase [Spirosoma sp. KNUC1025]|uniref:carboxylate-amine ligase n=1 Tax=Spirosoma sp. KNUC1025 TaxID=2894082 RepID=UPI001E31A9DE|nr:carboxylate-amine ligase [Spirosoma sp. KNUC1025]UFH57727.1 carboxylate-amine ligase [Spirosoma sp. KNUC1025]
MSFSPETFTIGVEEEYQIIHPQTRQLRSRAKAVLAKAQPTLGDQVTQEMYLSQIEIGTSICQTLQQVRLELQVLRGQVIAAAQKSDTRLVAAGTHPFSHWQDQHLTPTERYRGLETDFQQLTREQLIFGCHIHVGIPDQELAIQVMNRARPWLGALLALASNSPYWLGSDTGYASFRTEIWGRWPTAGIPQLFDSRADYDHLIQDLTAMGSIDDASKIYWDVRPSSHFDTLEFRVTDVCLTIDEAVLVAGLVRALVRTCALEAETNGPLPAIRPEIVQAAKWQAARFGLTQTLIDPLASRAVAAPSVIQQFLAYVRSSLEVYDDWDEVSGLANQVIQKGTGSARQRAAYQRAGKLEDVVDLLIRETAIGALIK